MLLFVVCWRGKECVCVAWGEILLFFLLFVAFLLSTDFHERIEEWTKVRIFQILLRILVSFRNGGIKMTKPVSTQANI